MQVSAHLEILSYIAFIAALVGETLICKPRGQVGCLKRGGYSLRVVLSDWSPEVYEALQVRLYDSFFIDPIDVTIWAEIHQRAHSLLYGRPNSRTWSSDVEATPRGHRKGATGGKLIFN